MRRTILTAAIVCLGMSSVFSQSVPWKKGIVTEEFIYDKAAFPSCHAATIAETPGGLVAAWFGGTKSVIPMWK